MPTAIPTAFAYDAFISYSHREDRELARTLQSSLENFARPIFRGRSMRVFRDETNLSARPDLWGAIEGALDRSCKLILLASPSAVASKWIVREVQHFVQKRGRDNVCIVQTMGELPWTAPPGTFRADSPEAALPAKVLDLLHRPDAEPLVIDLRPFRGTAGLTRAARAEYESKTAALAAELLGRDKDEIYGEHLRRQRRVLGLTVGAAVLSSCLAGVAVYEALRSEAARELAEQRQVLAEAGRADAILEDPWRWDTGLALALDTSLTQRSEKRLLPPELEGALVRAVWQANPHKVIDSRAPRPIAAVASRTGRLLTLGAGELRLWNAPYDTSVALPTAPGEGVLVALLAPDGRRVATFGDGPLVRIRNDRGATIADLRGGAGRVLSAALAPDGEHVLTAGEDHIVWIWDGSGGEPKVLYRGAAAVSLLAYAPLGDHVLVVDDGAAPRILDATNGALICLLEGDAWWREHPGRLLSAAFSPDGGRLVTTGDDQNVRVWNAKTGKIEADYSGHAGAVNAAAFSPDGGRVVSAGEDMTVRVWDLARSLHTILRGHTGPVGAVSFLPDGQHVVSAADDRTIRIWDAAPRGFSQVFLGSIHAPCGQYASPDGAIVVTVDGRIVRVWRSSTGELLHSLDAGESVASASVSPNGESIVTASSGGTIALWDVASGNRRWTHSDAGARLYSASFSPDGQSIVTAGVPSPARGPANGTVEIRRADSGEAVGRPLTGHVGPIYTVSFAPDGQRIASAGADGATRLWDARSGSEIRRLEGHTKFVATACFSHDGSRVITGGDDATARIWDSHSGLELAVIAGHADTVQSAFFAQDDATVFTAGDDHTLRWSRSSTGEELGRIDLGEDAHGYVGRLDENRILITMADETWIGSLSPVESLRRGCEIVGPLTEVPQVGASTLEGVHRECEGLLRVSASPSSRGAPRVALKP